MHASLIFLSTCFLLSDINDNNIHNRYDRGDVDSCRV